MNRAVSQLGRTTLVVVALVIARSAVFVFSPASQFDSGQAVTGHYISFLSRERIILASTDFVRIRTYARVVDAHAAEAVRLSRTACPGGHQWCAASFSVRRNAKASVGAGTTRGCA